jgi:hypothetical protein
MSSHDEESKKANNERKLIMKNLRFLLASVFCLVGVFIALGGAGLYLGSSKAHAQPAPESEAPTTNSPSGPDVVRLVGPVRLDQNLGSLPYVPPAPEIMHRPLTRYPRPDIEDPAESATPGFARFQVLIEEILPPVPNMPPPLLTFDGINFAEVGCQCAPPDTNGDVGPNHYVESVNHSFRVFDKNGNPLTEPITFNAFFQPLGNSTPCGASQNHGDPIAFYDQMADRWVITDLAYASFPGSSFWECIGVSQTSDPAGAYFLYALQVDPANPNRLGDYPKFALWSDAYYLTMNEFTDLTTFNGVRVYALDRASMITGEPTNAVGFTIGLAGVGDSQSLVAASFRTGGAPPTGEHEFLLAVDSMFPGVTLTQVHGWYFHVDFIIPENSTIGLGPDHTPNAEITVDPFVEAWTAETFNLVPQQGTTDKLDTLGYWIMTPVVYQNRNGTESLWADQTVMLNYPDGPTAINWYQFDVTDGNFPATPVQQQTWTNNKDGLWRWMPSIAVDQNGNTAIGYSISSPSMFPSVRYAGRLASDPLNDLGQGEAIMTNGTGSQTDTGGRWGDYSMTTIDPADGISFWHTNEYYVTTSSLNWFTRVGKFQLPAASPTPTPTATPRPRATPTPRPRPTAPPRP